MSTPERARVAFPLTVTSVGALVVRDDCLLVARMTYGPNRGRYMLPGGAVEPGSCRRPPRRARCARRPASRPARSA